MTGCAEQFKEGGNWMDEERSKVRVMSEEEKEQYDGVTIIEGTEETEASSTFRHGTDYRRHRDEANSKFPRFSAYTSHHGWTDWLWKKSDWTTRLALILGVSALLVFLFFIALPVLLVLGVVGGAVWLLSNLLLH